jgi:hypothetical protein
MNKPRFYSALRLLKTQEFFEKLALQAFQKILVVLVCSY